MFTKVNILAGKGEQNQSLIGWNNNVPFVPCVPYVPCNDLKPIRMASFATALQSGGVSCFFRTKGYYRGMEAITVAAKRGASA